jgi:hypothetical protein
MRYVASLLMVGLLTACDPPPAKAPVGAAVVEMPRPKVPLPPAVEATVERLLAVADTGDYHGMVALAKLEPDFRSNAAGMTHSEYWYLKQRTGDEPTAQLKRVLGYRPVERNSPQGKVWIWPAYAVLKPAEITPAIAKDIDQLLGPGEAKLIKAGGLWPGYVLGIAEDGRWLYFVSGEG